MRKLENGVESMDEKNYYSITPEILHYTDLCTGCNNIAPELYGKYNVKRGLRDERGKGVLVGLTEISEVCATKIENGRIVPDDGQLFYRGYNVEELLASRDMNDAFGFEEATYLRL